MRKLLLLASLGILLTGATGSPASATFSGSGGWVPYSHRTTGSSYDLRLVKSSRSQTAPLWPSVNSPFAGGVSPDGDRVVYFSNAGGDWEIWAVDIDGTNNEALTFNSADDREPSFSPNGRKIVFARDHDVWVMDADGSDAHEIYPATSAVRPMWHPNGTRIAFSESNGIDYDIVSIKTDGSGLATLANEPTDEIIGDYSPSGSKIAYSRPYGSGHEAIFSMHADGTHERPLIAPGGADVFLPRYSSSGKYLLYNRTPGPGVELWHARASDGSQRDALIADGDDNYLSMLE